MPVNGRIGCVLAGRFAVAAVFLFGAPRLASAQLFEDIGIRAQGMGGAFVAIADDSTATWWNPAGLATGAYFNGIVERSYSENPLDETTLGVSFALPSLGVSYYRLRITAIPVQTTTGSTDVSREDQTAIPLQTYVLHQFGVTVGQSLGEHFVLASSLRIVHADDTHGDQDLGVIAKFGSLRAGAVVKHLYEPDLTAYGVRVGLDRQARVGVAYAPQVGTGLTVDADLDADLTKTITAFGYSRRIAGGAELHVGRRFAVRAGGGAHTTGDTRRSFSAGASAGILRGMLIDARVTRGDDAALNGWGFDLRVTY